MKRIYISTFVFTILIGCIVGLSACKRKQEPHEHSFGEWGIETPSTCTADGEERRVCGCGEYEVRTIDAKGHNEEKIGGQAPTCTTEGLTDGMKCVDCGVITVLQQTVEKLAHNEQILPGKAPTCTADGITDGKYCTSCGIVTVPQNTIAKIPHTEVVIKGKAATCTAEGVTDSKYCTDCGVTTVAHQIIPMLSHTEAVINGRTATCKEEGITDGKYCTSCGIVTVPQNTIAKIPHTEAVIKGKAATCTAEGVTDSKYCTVCGVTTVAHQIIPILSHTEAVINGRPATCKEEGLTVAKYCTSCGIVTVEHKMIPTLSHDEATLTGRAPTCFMDGLTDGKYCIRCGEVTVEQITLSRLSHTPELLPGHAASCSEYGMTDGIRCGVCLTVIEKQELIPPLSHIEQIIPGKAASCIETGLTEGKICTNCQCVTVAQQVIPKISHNEIIIPGRAASCTETGLTDGSECTECGVLLKEQQIIGIIPHPDIDRDGSCDVCCYVICAHVYDKSVWSSDSNGHWHDVSCSCDVVLNYAAHIDKDKNGICDVCLFVVCVHTFSDMYSTDISHHWYENTCGCIIPIERMEHTDTDRNGICDECDYRICSHNPSAEWSADIHRHWHTTDCGCLLNIDEGEHIFLDESYTCAVCLYTCHHERSEVWSTDNDGHWQNTLCDHKTKIEKEPHTDSNRDGACDTCGWENPDHTHIWAVGYDNRNHYLYSVCEHRIVKDISAHTDADANKICDICDASLSTVSDVIKEVTSPDATAKVSGGIYENESGSVVYNFFTDHLTIVDSETVYYLSTYEHNGIPTLFKIALRADENTPIYCKNSTDPIEMNGPQIAFDMFGISSYGIEGFVAALYEYMSYNGDKIVGISEKYEAESGVLDFSFAVLREDTDENAKVVYCNIRLEISRGAIKNASVTFNGYEYFDCFVDTENGVFVSYSDATPKLLFSINVQQDISERKSENNPYRAEDMLILDLTIQSDGTPQQIKDGDTVEIYIGKTNGITLNLPDVDFNKAAFNNLTVRICDRYGDEAVGILIDGEYPYFIYTDYTVGEYTVTVSAVSCESVSFNLSVIAKPPTSLFGAVIEEEIEREVNKVISYPNVSVTLGVISGAPEESRMTTPTVSAGNGGAITFTPVGEYWCVTASTPGVYVIKFTSVMNDASAVVTLVVEEAPTPTDLLFGSWIYNGQSESLRLNFIPEYDGASGGVAEIEYVNTICGIDFCEEFCYSFSDGVITLSCGDDERLEIISGIFITNDYRICVSLKTNTDIIADLVLSRPNVTVDDVLMSDIVGSWSGSESGGIVDATCTIVINADGSGSCVYNSGFVNSFIITGIKIDGASVTVLYVENDNEKQLVFIYENGTLTTNSGIFTGTLTLTRDVEVENPDDFADLSPESLASVWSGESENASYRLSIDTDFFGNCMVTDKNGESVTHEIVFAQILDESSVMMVIMLSDSGEMCEVFFTYLGGKLTTESALFSESLTLFRISGN